MRRRWMLTGVWVLSTLAATLVAWGAVRLVADQVSPGALAAPPTAIALAEVDPAAEEAAASEAGARATPRGRTTQQPRPRRTAAAPPTRPAAPDEDPPDEDPPAGEPGDAGEQPGSGAEGTDPRQPTAGDDEADGQASDPEPVATTRAYALVGGVVTVRYQGTTTRLVEASPNSGFVVEVHDGGPGKVDVRFRSDEHESRFVTRIRNGSPDPQREERPR